MHERSIEAWPDALERACAACAHVRRARVLRETASTQDAAMMLDGDGPALVTAGRQVAGRGRLGSVWADTGQDGVACTFVVTERDAERLSMIAAVAAAGACRDAVPDGRRDAVGLKWPNDVIARCADGAWRKVAGALVEVRDGRVCIGIGINVRQRDFVPELGDRAASLHQIGSSLDRLAVIERLLARVDEAIGLDPAALADRFRGFDRTVGLRLRFQTAEGPVEGEVIRCDPALGLEIRAAQGLRWLPAATTRVEQGFWSSRSTMVPPCDA
jgi:BirA family biotin operon repressor/biotin-[acetyl-CoA-carboxylase] ligase